MILAAYWQRQAHTLKAELADVRAAYDNMVVERRRALAAIDALERAARSQHCPMCDELERERLLLVDHCDVLERDNRRLEWECERWRAFYEASVPPMEAS